VDIEPNGSGSGFSVQPMQMAQMAVNTATTHMNVNKETGVPNHNPPPQLPDPAATNYCPATDPVPGQSYTGPSKKLSAAIAKAKEQTGMKKILNPEVKVTKMKIRSKRFLPA
jgi:hypothetical protein